MKQRRQVALEKAIRDYFPSCASPCCTLITRPAWSFVECSCIRLSVLLPPDIFRVSLCNRESNWQHKKNQTGDCKSKGAGGWGWKDGHLIQVMIGVQPLVRPIFHDIFYCSELYTVCCACKEEVGSCCRFRRNSPCDEY